MKSSNIQLFDSKFTGLKFQWRFIVNTLTRISCKKIGTLCYVDEPVIDQNMAKYFKIRTKNFMYSTMFNMSITWSLLRNLREEKIYCTIYPLPIHNKLWVSALPNRSKYGICWVLFWSKYSSRRESFVYRRPTERN